jgi:hypothetical protein
MAATTTTAMESTRITNKAFISTPVAYQNQVQELWKIGLKRVGKSPYEVLKTPLKHRGNEESEGIEMLKDNVVDRLIFSCVLHLKIADTGYSQLF